MKILTALLLIITLISRGQINAYAKVTAINGGATTLTVTNVNEAAHTFTVGGNVIVMQMQDNVIGTNTTNINTFGNLGSIANGGNFEIRTIASRLPAVGTPTSITLNAGLINTYNVGANSSVQLITFRNMGVNFTTTANITGLAWNGNVGGVIAFEVANILTLNHSVSADAIGFRGGARSNDLSGPVCAAGNSTPYMANNANQGWKGEGIYKNINTTFNNSRGKILTGGGGGNDHNAGGGGGGNYSTGGQGGNGYSNCTAYPGGGLGGISLSGSITGSRIFMGGGGGGGQQNNSVGSAGGNGGGIVLIKATVLATSTICTSAIKVTANGQTAANTGNDGAGGGGAAGSIILQITTYSANPACPLSITANAGGGGNCNDGGAHAGGGGGGQGAIVFSTTTPTVNISVATNNGLPGKDNSGGSVSGTSGGGANNDGVIPSSSGVLPIELLYFDGEKENAQVKLFWETTYEKDNDYFTIEKSSDAINFVGIGDLKSKGNSFSNNEYKLYDINPFSGINYYRLKQTNIDRTFKHSQTINVQFNTNYDFSIFPNPLNNNQTLLITLNNNFKSQVELTIYDASGKIVITRFFNIVEQKDIKLENLNLSSGLYVVRLNNDFMSMTKKLIIE
jgi:hypothetical protein